LEKAAAARFDAEKKSLRAAEQERVAEVGGEIVALKPRRSRLTV